MSFFNRLKSLFSGSDSTAQRGERAAQPILPLARSIFEAARDTARVTIKGYGNPNRPARSFLIIARAASEAQRQSLLTVAVAYMLSLDLYYVARSNPSATPLSGEVLPIILGDLLFLLQQEFGPSGPDVYDELDSFVQNSLDKDEKDPIRNIVVLTGFWLTSRLKTAQPTREELESGAAESVGLWHLAKQQLQQQLQS